MRYSTSISLSAVLISAFLLCSEPAFAATDTLTFFGWSDQHVKTDGTGEHLMPAIDAMNAMPGTSYPLASDGKVDEPVFVFGLGDITEWPTHAAKDTYNKLITGRLKFPSFDVAGNHDSGGLSPSPTIHDWLTRRHKSLCYTFDAGGVHFVALYSGYDESLNSPAQPITKEALDYLRSDLAKLAEGTPVVVGTHLCFDAITNKDELVDAFGDANVILVLGGHYHKASANQYRGFNFVQLPSPAPGSPDEFTVFRISADRLLAVPFDYRSKEWISNEKKILNVKIKGPVKKNVNEAVLTSKPGATIEIGQEAPDFSLPGVDGRRHSLRDFSEAKILVVVFMCNHCPTSQAYEERIKKLVIDFSDKGVAIVAISPNDPKAVRLDELGYADVGDSFEEMKIHAQNKGFNFPYLYDGDNQIVSRSYGPATTPHVFIFDRERRLRYVGRVDDNERTEKASVHDTGNAIEALLAGRPAPVETTRPFGCSIKWSYKRDSAKKALERWANEDVSLATIDEKGIRSLLKNDSEQLRLVNFWRTRCGGCVAEFPDLIDIHRMYRNRDFELITISMDIPSEQDKVLSFLKKQSASCKNYQSSLENPYELIGKVDWPGIMPYTLLIAPGGRVLSRHEGQIDPLKTKRDIVGFLGRHYK